MRTREEDLAVIKEILRGRHQDYSVLVNHYSNYVFTLTMRYIHQRELAEELTQDVFIKAFNNLSSFRGECKFSTWLYTIVHTTCLSHLRKKNTAHSFPGDEKIASIHDDKFQYNPGKKLEKEALKTAINDAITHLSDIEAQIITLFYQGEQTVEEITLITGLTTANVKVKLFRARQKLKDIIEKHYRQELMN